MDLYRTGAFSGYPVLLDGGIVAALIDGISGRAQMGNDPLNRVLCSPPNWK